MFAWFKPSKQVEPLSWIRIEVMAHEALKAKRLSAKPRRVSIERYGGWYNLTTGEPEQFAIPTRTMTACPEGIISMSGITSACGE